MTLLSWPEVHGALTHMPLAFLLAVPVFELAAFLSRRSEFRVVSFWLLVAAIVMAVPSLLTGLITAREVFSAGRAPAQFQPHWISALTASSLAIASLVWRIKTRDRQPSRLMEAPFILSLCAALVVGYTGYLGGKMVFGDESSVDQDHRGMVPLRESARPAIDPKLVKTGEKLFAEYRCQACHRMNGEGAATAPDLTHEARRQSDLNWHIAHLKNPEKMKPGSAMPPFGDLPSDELKALAAFLATRK